jgi:outer membrane protein assembly factor BamD
MEDYRAAMVAFQNTLRTYPDIPQREEISYLTVKSSYRLASNSIAEKEIERYQETIRQYLSFKEEFSQSKYLKEIEKYYENAAKFIAKPIKTAAIK